jgi:hypothetical protein
MRIHRVCLVVAVLAASLLAARSAPAQVLVRGIVVDAGTGAPIPSARVVLSASHGGWAGELHTDSAGSFSFSDVRSGAYNLRLRRVGYRNSGGSLRLSADSIVELRLRMAVASVALEPVTVVARSPRQVSPVLRGFYQRMSNGPGRFVTREEIESQRPTRVTDVLRHLPNLNSTQGRGGVGGAAMSRGGTTDRCTMVFFVDGMMVGNPSQGTPWSRGPRTDRAIDDYVQPGDIEGIEIYRGESDTPAEFVTRHVGCGTIVIWTRRGQLRSGNGG